MRWERTERRAVHLRSLWTGSSIVDPEGALSLDWYQAAHEDDGEEVIAERVAIATGIATFGGAAGRGRREMIERPQTDQEAAA